MLVWVGNSPEAVGTLYPWVNMPQMTNPGGVGFQDANKMAWSIAILDLAFMLHLNRLELQGVLRHSERNPR